MMRTLFAIALILVVVPAFGQNTDLTATTRLFMPYLIAAGIAYLTRRREIGGWLFCFYFGLLLATPIVTLLMVTDVLPSYLNTEGWDMFYWWMAVLHTIPPFSAKLAVFVIGVILLFKSQRNRKNLKMMRIALLAMLIFSLASAFIGYRYWPEEGIIGELFQVGYALIWCLYWFISRRVKYVMHGDREWNYEEFLVKG